MAKQYALEVELYGMGAFVVDKLSELGVFGRTRESVLYGILSTSIVENAMNVQKAIDTDEANREGYTPVNSGKVKKRKVNKLKTVKGDETPWSYPTRRIELTLRGLLARTIERAVASGLFGTSNRQAIEWLLNGYIEKNLERLAVFGITIDKARERGYLAPATK